MRAVLLVVALSGVSAAVLAGTVVDEGTRAAAALWDWHPTVYEVLGSFMALAAATFTGRRLLRLLQG